MDNYHRCRKNKATNAFVAVDTLVVKGISSAFSVQSQGTVRLS